MKSISRRCKACIYEQLERRVFLSATLPTNYDIGGSLVSVNEAGGVIAQYVPGNGGSPPAPPSILFAAGNLEESQGLVTTVSINAGANWSQPSVIATGNDGLPEAYGQSSAAFDSNGNLFLAYLDQNRQQIDVLMQHNSDVVQAAGPTTFSNVGTLTGNVSHPELAISSVTTTNNNVSVTTDYIWLIYQRSNGIVYSQATDSNGSVTPFQTAKELRGSVGGFLPSVASASGPGASPEIAVAFQKSLGRTGTGIYEASTTAPSVDSLDLSSFVTNSTVTDRQQIPAEPDYGIDAGAQVAIGPNPNVSGQNRVYVTYVQDYPAGGDNMDVYIRYKDSSPGWSSPMRVNDDGGLNSQFDPAIAVDPSSGDLGVTWYDARQDMGRAMTKSCGW